MTGATKPPPCNQVCWEWIPTHGHGPHTWAYTRSSLACGHHYDATARIWRWTKETRP